MYLSQPTPCLPCGDPSPHCNGSTAFNGRGRICKQEQVITNAMTVFIDEHGKVRAKMCDCRLLAATVAQFKYRVSCHSTIFRFVCAGSSSNHTYHLGKIHPSFLLSGIPKEETRGSNLMEPISHTRQHSTSVTSADSRWMDATCIFGQTSVTMPSLPMALQYLRDCTRHRGQAKLQVCTAHQAPGRRRTYTSHKMF